MAEKSQLRTAVEELNKTDTYSLILFAISKIKDVPEYQTLCELSYILDNNSLVSLLDYYGGMTIKIPTKAEFRQIVDALLIYQFVNLEGNNLSDVSKALNVTMTNDLKETYVRLTEILKDYNFNRG